MPTPFQKVIRMVKPVTDAITDGDTKHLLTQDPSIHLPLLNPLSVEIDVPGVTEVYATLLNPHYTAKDSVSVHCTAPIVNTRPV